MIALWAAVQDRKRWQIILTDSSTTDILADFKDWVQIRTTGTRPESNKHWAEKKGSFKKHEVPRVARS